MAVSELEKYRVIRQDPRRSCVPRVSWEDKRILNHQTAFNRRLLESSAECGCFHCGRRFPVGLIAEWMVEPGEEDTGLCPYCGEDALIVGAKRFPLATATLTKLHEGWFSSELEERKRLATDVPEFEDSDDFARKGIPFLWKVDESRTQLATISLDWISKGRRLSDGLVTEFPKHRRYFNGKVVLGGAWRLLSWKEETGTILTEEQLAELGAVLNHPPIYEVERFGLERNGVVVDITPHRGDDISLSVLCEEHGEKLVGMFKDPDFSKLAVLVER